MTTWLSRRRIPFVAQMTASECPVACLAMVLAHHGRPVPVRRLRAVLGTGRDGATAHALCEAARGFGLVGRGLRVPPAKAHELAPGTILHWEAKHFVVLERATREHAWIVDPAAGRRRVDADTLARSFSGLALAFAPDPACAPAELAAPEPSPAWRTVLGAAWRPGFLVPALLASLASAGLGIAGALVMTELVARLFAPVPRFADLVGLIAAIVVATVLVKAWRERALHGLGTAVERELGHGLAERLLRLPLAFFRHRTAGDLAGRVAGVHGLDRRVVAGVGAIVTEVPTMVAFLGVLCVWNATMAVAAVVIVAMHAVIGQLVRRREDQRAGAVVRSVAKAKAFEAQVLEQIGIIKAMGSETAIATRWSRLRADASEAADRHGRAHAVGQSGLEGFATLIPLAILAVGAHQVAAGSLGLPAMIGTNCLAVALFRPVAVLVAAVESLVAMRPALARIDDVMLEPIEPAATATVALELPAAIALHDVTVGSPGTAPTLDAVSFALEPVRHLAIVGGAAAGKSALAALLAGVSRSDAGHVELGGHDLELGGLGPDARACLVPAAAPLLDGNLRDNVALGLTATAAGDIDAAIADACRLVGALDEIEALPQRWATAVYDGGKGLSAGLRQRIVLARALAGQPRLLVLDEATASLGAAAEGQLVEALLAGPVRMLVTVTSHRSTLDRADAVVVLERGHVVDVGSPAELRARCARYRELTDPPLALLAKPTDARKVAGA